MRRHLHPGAWWLWSIGIAAGIATTNNPLLLGLALAVLGLVVVARRDGSPWGRSFRFYLLLAAFVVVMRLLLHVVIGLKFGNHRLLPLPDIRLPEWAAGVELGGTIYLEGLLSAGLEGARLATMIVAVGAANTLASPKRLLRVLPAALHEIGTAVVVAVTVAPQLTSSVVRVAAARRLRGDAAGGLRSFRRLAMPVLQDTLDSSLLLASAMDSRGYGRRSYRRTGTRSLTGGLTLAGLLGACVGSYGVLDTTTPAVFGTPVLVVGLLLAGVGLWLGGRSVPRTVYRKDPWLFPEWLTAASGAAVLIAFAYVSRTGPEALGMPLVPLGIPPLPLLPCLALVLATLPAFLTPLPPVPGPRRRERPLVLRTPG